ncbi:MAG: MFS transporter [Anaerolineae bacterium]
MIKDSDLKSREIQPSWSFSTPKYFQSGQTGFQLLLLTLADFIARTAYQMGKTPLLPLYAATLGADEIYLGFIASVSTMTGLVFKPLVGLLSDRHGRRLWLLIGTLFFIGMPFVYRFVTTPEQLIAIRLIHGLATAIYGPVSVAMVVEMSADNRAGRVGVFSLGRTGGYIFGPALAGYFLLTWPPAEIFTIIGFLSLFSLIPLLLLTETSGSAQPKSMAKVDSKRSFLSQVKEGLGHAMATPAVWLAGGFEAVNNMVTYTAKAFLPIYALSVGRNTLEAGLFFTVQQGVTMLAKPSLGWLSDRFPRMRVIGVAVIGLAIALVMLTFSNSVIVFFGAAVLLGLAEAIIIPASTALVAAQIDQANTGAGIGLVGSLQNGSKIIGPILAGFLIAFAGYEFAFRSMAIGIVLVCLSVGFILQRRSAQH